jgi:histidinol dehydrogenase
VRRLDSSAADFQAQLQRLTSWQEDLDQQVVATVDEIVVQVIARGDAALIEYTHRFDGVSVATSAELEVSRERMRSALEGLGVETRQALEAAAERIRSYHQHQVQESWCYHDEQGSLLGQQITPLQRVGVYVPGGKASYPSSVLMNVVPAKVAGVEEVIMVVPTPTGNISEVVLAAAAIAGVDRLFTIGGAQAIAALAYGTETVPAVDKIVGPGNVYVATAKRRVFGKVGIDMIAGPSEILVISDGSSNPDWIAMDLFSQAEHDEDAQSILLSPDSDFLDRVAASIERQLPQMERQEIIRTSLEKRGALIQVRDLDEAIAVSNSVAPEHLELAVDDAEQYLPQIRHAGAIFLGRYTPEAFGDYCAGPNHVLPTSGTARFSSPLGVYDFVKRSSVIQASEQGAQLMAPMAAELAQAESLQAHALSALYRLDKDS